MHPHPKKSPSDIVRAGNLSIGGDNPIRVQSMTNTPTSDVEASVKQCKALFDAGCELVRLTVINKRDAAGLDTIINKLRQSGHSQPIAADIHFLPALAEMTAEFADKVRINPGNFVKPLFPRDHIHSDEEYSDELKITQEKLFRLAHICKKNNTALRIGVNHGSLSPRIISKYGDTIVGMVESALEYIRIFSAFDFHELIISLKSSNVPLMISANRHLVARMHSEGFYYPLHLGVTEAGDAEDGRIKSAMGIGILLDEGIGNTIRVSLTEDPVNEIPFAFKLAGFYNQEGRRTKTRERKAYPEPQQDILKATYNDPDPEMNLIRASIELGSRLTDGMGKDVAIESNAMSREAAESLSKGLLQASRVKITKTEFIACPSCGRTHFNIEQVLREVKKHTNHLKGLKIAVMGCIVNGIGEMADADYGYVGSGPGKVTLYRGKEPVKKNIPEKSAVDELVSLIKSDGKWHAPS